MMIRRGRKPERSSDSASAALCGFGDGAKISNEPIRKTESCAAMSFILADRWRRRRQWARGSAKPRLQVRRRPRRRARAGRPRVERTETSATYTMGQTGALDRDIQCDRFLEGSCDRGWA